MNSDAVEATTPTSPTGEEKRRTSNLLASAGVNFERRYKSNQSNQNYHVGQTEVAYTDADGKEHRMEIVKVQEKIGNFRKCVPRLSIPVAVILCCVNLVLPGWGTIVGALRVACGAPSGNPVRSEAVGYGLLAGILQFLLCPLIIGWVWSILYGVYLIQDAGALSHGGEVGEPCP